MKKYFFALALAGLFGTTDLSGQVIDPGLFMAGTKEDAQYLAGEYLRPVGHAMAFGLHNGWYQSGRAKTKGSFSLMITPSVIWIPEEQRSFVIDESQLQSLRLVDPSDNVTPTAFGPSEPGPRLELDQLISPTQFNAPQGSGLNYLPLPMATFSVGLVLNTQAYVRYLPSVGIPGLDNSEVDMLGLGAMHELTPWLTREEEPLWNASVFMGFTRLRMFIPLDEEQDQEVVVNSNGFTLRGVVSRDFGIFTPYLGLGYNTGMTNIAVNGTFDPSPQSPGTAIEDPVDVISRNAGGLVVNLGGKLHFFNAIALSVDYSTGPYQSLTAGLGIDIDFDN